MRIRAWRGIGWFCFLTIFGTDCGNDESFPAAVERVSEEARAAYKERDQRLGDLVDEKVDIFYSCLLCQSFAPSHVCVITPERLGLCGAYSWLDGKAAFEIDPTGGNQPIEKGQLLDDKYGRYSGVDDYLTKASGGAVEQ